MQAIRGRHDVRYVGFRNHTGVDDRTLRKAHQRGELVKVRRGAFVPAGVWRSLDPTERYRLTVAAAAEMTERQLVLSHRSAAAIWGVPLVGAPPAEVDVLTSAANGSRTEHGFRRHATSEQDRYVVEAGGLTLTTLERTVVDLALSEPFPRAVVAADWALAQGVRRAELAALLDALDAGRPRPRAERVIAFADGRAGSPGESLSRALIHELGFPAPELQVPFRDRRGLIGIVDFYWPASALIGEFDGAVKYVDGAMLAGRSPADVLIAEKRREDRLRAKGPRVLRWVWSDLSPARLGDLLLDAGLKRERRGQ